MSSQHYWFKRRRYGIGWMPVTWQGWMVTIDFILFAGLATWFFPPNIFLPVIGVLALGLIGVCLVKGPTPHWRWGRSIDDDPNQDF